MPTSRFCLATVSNAERHCMQFNILHYLGNLSPWRTVNHGLKGTAQIPQGCTVEQVRNATSPCSIASQAIPLALPCASRCRPAWNRQDRQGVEGPGLLACPTRARPIVRPARARPAMHFRPSSRGDGQIQARESCLYNSTRASLSRVPDRKYGCFPHPLCGLPWPSTNIATDIARRVAFACAGPATPSVRSRPADR